MEGMGQKRRPLVVMASSSTAAVQAAGRGGANPLAELTDRFRSLETGVRVWMAKQPTHIEAAVTTAFGAVQGGALGGLMGTFAPEAGAGLPVPQPPPGLDPKALATFKQAQALAGGPLVQARNFAVMTGANAGISCVMRRIRGVEDVQGSMAAAFGSVPKKKNLGLRLSPGRTPVMEATAGSSRTLFLLTRSPPLVSTVRLALGIGKRRLVAAGARKRRGKDGDAGEERVDSHSFNPKAGEVTGPFPESVLLRKKTVKEDGDDSPEFADAEEEKLYELLNIQLESGLNLQRMRHYEVVYLIHEDRVEEAEDVISKVQEFVRERKGRIWRVNNWGLRRLAYKIKKATHANYVLMNFEIQAKCINDFKTLLDKDERIIRHLVMKRDEAITEDCPPPPEFHAMRSQQLDDEYIDEEYAKADDGDDEGENGNVDDDVEADDEPEIILVDEVDDDNAEDLRRRNRKIKLEKYTMGKVLR